MDLPIDNDKRVLLIMTLQDVMKRLAWIEDELCGLAEDEEEQEDERV